MAPRFGGPKSPVFLSCLEASLMDMPRHVAIVIAFLLRTFMVSVFSRDTQSSPSLIRLVVIVSYCPSLLIMAIICHIYDPFIPYYSCMFGYYPLDPLLLVTILTVLPWLSCCTGGFQLVAFILQSLTFMWRCLVANRYVYWRQE